MVTYAHYIFNGWYILVKWATLFLLTARDFLIYHPINRVAHITTFVIPAVDNWLE